MSKRIPEELTTDVLVIGGGLSGVCAAVQAARLGCSVVLLEKFRTLGGNSGPEVGVHPSGAHRFHPYAAETGIIEEMIEEAAWRGAKTLTYDHHYNMSQMWDGVLHDTLVEAGVQVLRCHYAKSAVVEDGRIRQVLVEDISTYQTRTITVGCAVVDSSGDGNVSAAAGAEFRMGREARSTYGERSAPEQADDITLGSSLVGYISRKRKPVSFTPPPGTPPYHPGYEHSPTRYPAGGESTFIYPDETGGEEGTDTILDDHEIYQRLLGQLYACWDRIKNQMPDNEEWELVWVSPRVARRESRRFVGDYTLTQTDVENGVIFDDAVAFGGFPEDLHYPRPENPAYIKIRYVAIPPLYSIPYRCLYSKDLDNLFFASRLESVSHIAHGTVRIQRTLATCGQAVGAAAALCRRYGCSPRDIYREHMAELQQLLLKEDASVMGKRNEDSRDLARKAQVSADTEVPFGVTAFDGFVPLDRPRGVMLWDWCGRLDTFSCYLKNTSAQERTVNAQLRLFTPEIKRKHSEDNKRFSYFRAHNQMEWGVDDTCSRFEPVCRLSAPVPAGFEGWVTFDVHRELIEKDPYNDDERYLVELEQTADVLWALSEHPYDFCRRSEREEGADNYTTSYDSHAFTMQPAPRYGEAANVIDGVSRRWSTNPVHMWIGRRKLPQYITLRWEEPQQVGQLQITFDTLKRTYMTMPFDCNRRVSDLLVKRYAVEALIDGEWRELAAVDGNYHRVNRVRFKPVYTPAIRLRIEEMWDENAAPRLYEIRAYAGEEE